MRPDDDAQDELPDDGPLLDPAALPETHLDGLGERFELAMYVVRRGDVDQAAELLRGILKTEPRLAEPRLELARILLETDQLEEAATQAEEAARILESGGQWIDTLPEQVVSSLAWDLHGEALRRQADRDEVVFGDPEAWRTLVEQSRTSFAKAAALDPENAHAHWWAGGTDAELLPPGAEDEDDDQDILDTVIPEA